MDELLTMMSGPGLDLPGLGMDAGIVAAVNEATNWVKERLEEWTWDDPYARYYPAIPFVCAFVLCFLTNGMPFNEAGLLAVGKSALAYGAAATVSWNLYKKSIKGE